MILCTSRFFSFNMLRNMTFDQISQLQYLESWYWWWCWMIAKMIIQRHVYSRHQCQYFDVLAQPYDIYTKPIWGCCQFNARRDKPSRPYIGMEWPESLKQAPQPEAKSWLTDFFGSLVFNNNFSTLIDALTLNHFSLTRMLTSLSLCSANVSVPPHFPWIFKQLPWRSLFYPWRSWKISSSTSYQRVSRA